MRGDRSGPIRGGILRRLPSAALFVALTLLVACNSDRKLPPIPQAAVTDYVLGPGDRLRFQVFGQEAASGEFTVGVDGNVATPLAGELKAAGLTTDQLQAEYKEALEKQGFYKNPKVAVEVLNYRPFYIMGEVKKPGSYPYASGLTVSAAVAEAGGFTPHGDHNLAIIERKAATGIARGRATSPTPVLPDDIIEVPQTIF
jgi:polysaccharide export outer membrane protein